MMKRLALVGGLAVSLWASSARATLLVADFNDITSGAINGKAGGTGWTGTWSGSAGGTVAAGDLTSTLYTVPQSGTAQRFRNINGSGLRQNYRTPAVSPTGTVWFSFLAMAEAAGDRAGLSINAPTPTPFDNTGTAYAYFVGDTLNFRFGAAASPGTAAGYAVNTAHLVVGQIVINGGGAADSVKLWVDPNLTANPDINAYAPVYSSTAFDALDGITTVGAVAARLDGASVGGGNVDNIRFSDGGGDASQAFTDVTGVSAAVPEPSAALAGIAVVGAGALRRSRRTRG